MYPNLSARCRWFTCHGQNRNVNLAKTLSGSNMSKFNYKPSTNPSIKEVVVGHFALSKRQHALVKQMIFNLLIASVTVVYQELPYTNEGKFVYVSVLLIDINYTLSFARIFAHVESFTCTSENDFIRHLKAVFGKNMDHVKMNEIGRPKFFIYFINILATLPSEKKL